jgi:hypothetical protein
MIATGRRSPDGAFFVFPALLPIFSSHGGMKRQPGIPWSQVRAARAAWRMSGCSSPLEELEIPIRAIVGCSISAEISAFILRGHPGGDAVPPHPADGT